VSHRGGGLRAWLLQRLSAVYMAVFMLYLLLTFAVAAPNTYGEWHDWMGNPWMGLASALFFAALLMHAWVGMRDVVMDYVHPTALRLSALSLVALGLAACGLWILRVLWQAGIS